MFNHHFHSVRFLLFCSFSLSASSSLLPSFFLTPLSLSSPSPSHSHSSRPSVPKATPSDLLSTLGSKAQFSSVSPVIAKQLKSCFKFLVPFTPTPAIRDGAKSNPTSRRMLGLQKLPDRYSREEDELIWWPPAPVLELARIAVDSGGDPAAIQRQLNPTAIRVPDVEGSNKNRCQLTRSPTAWNFISEELNCYLKFLFELIEARGPSIGFTVSLNRFDLFHGHLFLAVDSGRLGILFHAKEFPAYNKEVFPYAMGYCQRGSNVPYDDSMNLRNILWLAPLPSNSTDAWLAPGTLVVLDARPDGIIYRDLIPDYASYVRTIYEVKDELWLLTAHFKPRELFYLQMKKENLPRGIELLIWT